MIPLAALILADALSYHEGGDLSDVLHQVRNALTGVVIVIVGAWAFYQLWWHSSHICRLCHVPLIATIITCAMLAALRLAFVIEPNPEGVVRDATRIWSSLNVVATGITLALWVRVADLQGRHRDRERR